MLHHLMQDAGTFWRCATYCIWFLVFDYPMLWMMALGHMVAYLLTIKRKATGLLNGDSLQGDCRNKRILVVGNGPSVMQGEPLGSLIDEFDEVVRFNNFQTKNAGAEAFAGTKCTVHFSDAMLFPTYPEYHVPGAKVVLAQFDERLMTAGSYLLFRMAVDLEIRKAWKLLCDPELEWIPREEIAQLKQDIGNTGFHHPTSGLMAINHFLKLTDQPVHIHGFDFFEGDKIHYYNKSEPLYERINNHFGVNMHQPQKEKKLVGDLVAQGRVRWLKDLASERKRGGQ